MSPMICLNYEDKKFKYDNFGYWPWIFFFFHEHFLSVKDYEETLQSLTQVKTIELENIVKKSKAKSLHTRRCERSLPCRYYIYIETDFFLHPFLQIYKFPWRKIDLIFLEFQFHTGKVNWIIISSNQIKSFSTLNIEVGKV